MSQQNARRLARWTLHEQPVVLPQRRGQLETEEVYKERMRTVTTVYIEHSPRPLRASSAQVYGRTFTLTAIS